MFGNKVTKNKQTPAEIRPIKNEVQEDRESPFTTERACLTLAGSFAGINLRQWQQILVPSEESQEGTTCPT
jgi:hypothetical protein